MISVNLLLDYPILPFLGVKTPKPKLPGKHATTWSVLYTLYSASHFNSLPYFLPTPCIKSKHFLIYNTSYINDN